MLPIQQENSGKIIVCVKNGGGRPIRGALVSINSDYNLAKQEIKASKTKKELATEKGRQIETTTYEGMNRTDKMGCCEFDSIPIGSYAITCHSFNELEPIPVEVGSCQQKTINFQDPITLTITPKKIDDKCLMTECDQGMVGQPLCLLAEADAGAETGSRSIQEELIRNLTWDLISGNASLVSAKSKMEKLVTPQEQGALVLRVTAFSNFVDEDGGIASFDEFADIPIVPAPIQPIAGDIKTTTTMTRTATAFTEDTALFVAINNATNALSFDNYLDFMNSIFCVQPTERKDRNNGLLGRRFLPFTDTDSYRLVKAATEAFVMVNCGVQPFEKEDNNYLNRRDLPMDLNGGLTKYLVEADGVKDKDGNAIKILPYLAVIRSKLPDIPIKKTAFGGQLSNIDDLDECFGILQEKLANPCFLELIWSYWQEEGMLVQTINAISRRFQNMRAPNVRDPLANLEMNPLRPLNNLMWGYIQDEQHRLSVVRRNYEYDHHYGLRLDGKALRDFRPADTRSKFLEGFHHLLRLCTVFYKQDDDTTVKADAFPVLNALKEVHLILSQGAHNQFGDLPSTSRIEMLIQQWFLARPEFREFLPTRIMVAYPEPWMDRVDAMKKIQGWTDTSVLHFRNLAIFGEQMLLSIRWGHWSDVFEPTQAFNWARLYRPQVQGYIHAYRAATGVDLSADPTVDTRVDSTLPSLLLQRRLATQQRAV